MKQRFLIFLLIFLSFTISGCECNHKWLDATCTSATTCSICGEMAGNPIGHVWNDATCTTAKTCAICKTTDGNPLDHDWQEATILAPQTCLSCGETIGDPLINNNHDNSSDVVQNICLLCNNVTSRETTLYCSSHDCTIYDCSYPAKSNNTGGWGSYCAFHGCCVNNCLGIPIGGTNYCASHIQ